MKENPFETNFNHTEHNQSIDNPFASNIRKSNKDFGNPFEEKNEDNDNPFVTKIGSQGVGVFAHQ